MGDRRDKIGFYLKNIHFMRNCFYDQNQAKTKDNKQGKNCPEIKTFLNRKNILISGMGIRYFNSPGRKIFIIKSNNIIKNASYESARKCDYGCGLFVFEKSAK